MHPLGYFASAPDGTNDSLILHYVENQIGSYAEKLTSSDKSAFLAVLSRYLYFKQWVVPDYSIGQAIANTRPNIEAATASTTLETGDIWDMILTLDGISNQNALGLLLFITQQQSQEAGIKARATCFNSKELSLAVTAALDAFYQVVSLQELLTIALDQATESVEKRQQRTELLTICYLHQVKPYIEELQQELKEIRQRVPRAYVGQMASIVTAQGCNAGMETAPVGQQAIIYHYCSSGIAAVIDPPNDTWLIPLPKGEFTMPKFRFGQRVQSQSRETIGRIIGMEFAPDGSELAYQISRGWHYVIQVTEHPDSLNRRLEQDSLPEADLKLI